MMCLIILTTNIETRAYIIFFLTKLWLQQLLLMKG